MRKVFPSKSKRYSRKFLLILSFLPILLSCGVYTFSPSAIGDIKTVGIPLFDNQTTESGLREMLTDQLSQAFVSDNIVKIAPQNQADGIIKGTVTNYLREAYTYSQAEAVSQYKCTITVSVEFTNRRSDKVIWADKSLSNWGLYDSATESEDIGKQRAVAKLVEDIVNKTVKGW